MKRKLLVVDDDRSVSESLKKLLEAEGFEVLTARDGAEAIEHFRAREINLVVLDINLGNDNGWDVFQAMAEINPFVPTIVITAEWGQRDRAVAAGAEALIEKPIDVPSFLKLIDDLLEEEVTHRLHRVGRGESHCRYLAKDYTTFLKLLQERRSAPLKLPTAIGTAMASPASRGKRDLPAKKSTVIGDPTGSSVSLAKPH